jgi:hypothetical protein
MMLAALLVLSIAVPQAAQPQPPRDRRITVSSAVDPASVAAAIQLAKQQEERGAVADAEATLLNGAPVPVIMTVTVNFTMQ